MQINKRPRFMKFEKMKRCDRKANGIPSRDPGIFARVVRQIGCASVQSCEIFLTTATTVTKDTILTHSAVTTRCHPEPVAAATRSRDLTRDVGSHHGPSEFPATQLPTMKA